MSKSAGNATAPQDVVKQYGADILRLWVAQTDYAVDQRIGPEILKGTADSYRRLRNTLRFLLGALDGFDEAERIEPAAMPELERWVLHRLAELDRAVRERLRRLRLPARLPDALPVRHRRSLGASTSTSARTRSTATPRPTRAAAPPAPCSTRSSTGSSPGWRRCWPSPWRRSGSTRFPGEESSVHLQRLPRDARAPGSTPRSPRSGRRSAGPPRRHRRARDRAPRQAHRRQPRGGAGGPCRRRRPPRGARVGRLRRRLHHLGPRPRAGDPAPADAFTLDDAPGVAVVPALADGREVRPLLEDPARRRHPRATRASARAATRR